MSMNARTPLNAAYPPDASCDNLALDEGRLSVLPSVDILACQGGSRSVGWPLPGWLNCHIW